MAQGGDFERFNGTGGSSIYGNKFADENFIRKHTGRGLLSMANAGRNTNGSQFFITFGATPHLDGKHVVFGKLVKGGEVLKAIEQTPTKSEDRPVREVKVVDCGVVEDATPVPSSSSTSSTTTPSKPVASSTSTSPASKPSSTPSAIPDAAKKALEKLKQAKQGSSSTTSSTGNTEKKKESVSEAEAYKLKQSKLHPRDDNSDDESDNDDVNNEKTEKKSDAGSGNGEGVVKKKKKIDLSKMTEEEIQEWRRKRKLLKLKKMRLAGQEYVSKQANLKKASMK